jgi:NAD(P)-dependent dehydrogenase (short-subunit alcohol dehydrogenase family)
MDGGQMSVGDIRGKVAIVTGAGRGIGRGIALSYGRAGAKVVVASRSSATVESVSAEICNEGGTALGISCDVGQRDQIFGVAERAARAYGSIDILVNNAQSFGPAANPSKIWDLQPLETFDEDDWEHTYRTGLLATLWGMKAVFPHMRERGGKIINMSSMAGQVGNAGSAAYNVTKEGIRALTRTAAREWGRYGINVNVISPSIRTDALDQFERANPEFIEGALAQVPLGRFGDPVKDAGPLAIFLASSASDFITGMTFMLDGGLLMYP